MNWTVAEAPLIHFSVCNALRLGDFEAGEAIEEGGADVELGDLTVEGARYEALSDELQAPHLGFHPRAQRRHHGALPLRHPQPARGALRAVPQRLQPCPPAEH